MDINEFFESNPTVINLEAENRWQAIEELVDYLATHGRIDPGDRDAIVQTVRKREISMSSGIGFGIGIPHAATPLVSRPMGLIGVSRKGIQFEALDNKLVKVVVLFLVPEGQAQKHLNILADIAKMVRRPDFQKLLADTTG
jgi:nitrogen PTS system EIIA component